MEKEQRIAGGHTTAKAEDVQPAGNTQEAELITHLQTVSFLDDEVCMICDRPQTNGLHICGEFICVDCEREMINTDVRDARYPFFIHQMKQVWQRKNA